MMWPAMGAPMMPVPMKAIFLICKGVPFLMRQGGLTKVTGSFVRFAKSENLTNDPVTFVSPGPAYCPRTLRAMRSVNERDSRRSLPQKSSATMPGPTWAPMTGPTEL